MDFATGKYFDERLDAIERKIDYLIRKLAPPKETKK